MSLFGFERDTTPFIKELAEQATVYRSAYTPSFESAPSHASMLTGRYPQSHGIIWNGAPMDKQQLTLAHLFNQAGYNTAAIVNFPLLAKRNMTGKDFGAIKTVTGTPSTPDLSDPRGHVYGQALRWIRSNWRKKHFAWVHSQFLHLDPAPEPYASMFLPQEVRDAVTRGEELRLPHTLTQKEHHGLRRQYNSRSIDLHPLELEAEKAFYDGNLRLTDDCLRSLWAGLKKLGLDTYTIFAIVSDHGVSLGEDHRISHTGIPRDHLFHVPMLIGIPGQQGNVVEDLVETIDLAPTLLNTVGLDIPRRMQGQDLFSPTRMARDAVYAYGNENLKPWYGMGDGTWRYFGMNEEEGLEGLEYLPDHHLDFTPVQDKYPKQHAAMREQLKAWASATPDVGITQKGELSEEIKEMLRKAGYLDGVQ
jgi:arylsulfatase A-like enzyme